MRVSLVVGAMHPNVIRLQPWRYLSEMARGLAALGHRLTVITDVPAEECAQIPGCELVNVPSVRTVGRGPESLVSALSQSAPDVALWHIGRTSPAHTWPPRFKGVRHIAVFTSPLYSAHEMWRIRRHIMQRPTDYSAHLAGISLPLRAIAAYLHRCFDRTIVLVPSTAERLSAAGLRRDKLSVLLPGREPELLGPGAHDPKTVTFVYAGNSLPIRGTEILTEAFALAHRDAPRTRLRLLCRREHEWLHAQEERLRKVVEQLAISQVVDIVGGVLPRPEFVRQVTSADAMVLPFLLVPSEAPLLLLEAASMGMPLITTRTAGLPDIAADGSILVPPGDVRALGSALRAFATQPSLRQNMIERGGRWIQAYPTWEQQAQHLQSILNELLGSTSQAVA